MADLQGFNLDPNVAENTGDFTVIPESWQKFVIVGDELTDTKAGNGKMLILMLQIVEGQHAGEIIKDRLNIINPSEVAQKIGQGTLKRLCNLTGVPYPPPSTEKMYGKPIMGKVTIEEFKSNTTGKDLKSNKISKYEAVSSKPQREQASAQPQPAGSW